MKTLYEWEGKTRSEILGAFDEPDDSEIEILLAAYSDEDYHGSAFVLFKKGGVLYEVNASHDSYSGLDGQWDPEETTVEALLYRMDSGYGDTGDEFMKSLRDVLALQAKGS